MESIRPMSPSGHYNAINQIAKGNAVLSSTGSRFDNLADKHPNTAAAIKAVGNVVEAFGLGKKLGYSKVGRAKQDKKINNDNGRKNSDSSIKSFSNNAQKPIVTSNNNRENGNVGHNSNTYGKTSPKPLDGGIRISGNFKTEGQKPNAVLYRQDNDGTITSYAVYDDKGMILKRVDMKGAPHRGIPTPHVVDYGRSHLPDGTIRVNSNTKEKPRPARPDELQYKK